MICFTLLVLSFASSILSVPVDIASTFAVEANPIPDFEPHGPSALLHAYRKYGIPIPEGLEDAAKLRKRGTQTGSTAATPNGNDLQYLSQVTVGGQNLNMVLDTGSADLWVFSSKQPASQLSGHAYYNPSSSKTFKNMDGSTFEIGYGDGSQASGNVGTDTVTIGGTTVQSQAVEYATDVSGAFVSNTNLDGIVGMGFSSINTVMPNLVPTFFENAQSSLAKGLFTADLRHAAKGYYNFGWIDKTKYTGSILYAALDNSRGLWGFAANGGFKIGKTHYADSFGAPNGAIADTGTTLILMSDAVVQTYYSKIKGARYAAAQGGWIFPCTVTAPDFSVNVGTKFAVVKGTTMNYSTVSSTMCYGGLQSLGSAASGTPYIYGDVALKNWFAVFDAQNSRFGFALKSGN